jgi:hypothetical protein
MTPIDELIQTIRELKLSQIRKQLLSDSLPRAPKYVDYPNTRMVNRYEVVEEFFKQAKKKKP